MCSLNSDFQLVFLLSAGIHLLDGWFVYCICYFYHIFLIQHLFYILRLKENLIHDWASSNRQLKTLRKVLQIFQNLLEGNQIFENRILYELDGHCLLALGCLLSWCPPEGSNFSKHYFNKRSRSSWNLIVWPMKLTLNIQMFERLNYLSRHLRMVLSGLFSDASFSFQWSFLFNVSGSKY